MNIKNKKAVEENFDKQIDTIFNNNYDTEVVDLERCLNELDKAIELSKGK